MQSPHPFVNPRSLLFVFFLFFLLVMVGTWMKILHAPGSDIVLGSALIGEAIAVLSLIYLSVRTQTSHSMISSRSVLISFIVLFLLIIAGAWMKILHIPGAELAMTVGLIGEATAIIGLIYLSFRKKI